MNRLYRKPQTQHSAPSAKRLFRSLLWLNLALAFICTGATADTNQTLLASISEQANRISAIEGRFQQIKTIAVLPLPLQSSGSFSYSRTDGIDWITEHPLRSQLRISPSDGVAASDAEGKLQKVDSPDALAGIFLGLFSGDFSDTQALFSIQATGTTSRWQLELVPSNELLVEQLTRVQINGAATVERVQLWEANGDMSDIRLVVERVIRAADAMPNTIER